MGMTMKILPPPLEKKSQKEILTAMRKAYAQADEMLKGVVEENPVSCGKGCAACCEILTALQVPEGLILADAILRRKDWKGIGRDLRAQAKLVCDPQLTHEKYFQSRLVCPLLDKRTKECIFYDVRPAACRTHLVCTPREICGDHSPKPRPQVASPLGTREAEHYLWGECTKIFHHPIAAPLQLMVLFCFPMLREHPYNVRLLSGLPDPIHWMELIKENLAEMAVEAVGTIIPADQV
jgi:Fe-S-cluster containining protein